MGNDFKLAELGGTSGEKWPKIGEKWLKLLKNWWKRPKIGEKWPKIGGKCWKMVENDTKILTGITKILGRPLVDPNK